MRRRLRRRRGGGRSCRRHHRAGHPAHGADQGVTFLQGDFREAEVLERLRGHGGRLADIVVSDMAPNLSGIESADTARIAHLVELAVEFAREHMKPEGALVAKLFHGSGYGELTKLFKANFRVAKAIKPKASRGQPRKLSW